MKHFSKYKLEADDDSDEGENQQGGGVVKKLKTVQVCELSSNS